MFRPLILAAATAFSGLAAATVTIDPANTRQVIHGFGTCLVSWGKDHPDYDDEMATIYTKTMGFTILRTSLAAWAYPKTDDPQAITPDRIDLADKNNSRLPVFLDFAKKLKVIEPNLKVIGTVWSPVAWLKLNNQITAGKGDKKEAGIRAGSYQQSGKGKPALNRVDPKLFPHFVAWMIAQMQQYKENGTPLYAVSPGNEILFSQEFESCVWTAEDFATIVGMLGKAKAEAGLADTKIFGPETMTKHNWADGNQLFIKELHKNTEAFKVFDIYATHGYVDGFEEDVKAESSLEFWNLIKDDGKEYWMTEGGTGDHAWPAPLAGVAAGVHNSLVAGNANAFVPWQVSGKEANTHCLIPGRTLSKKSHAMRHFSVFIRPGAKRIDLGQDTGALRVSAYLHNEDHRLVVVAINPTKEAQDLTVVLKDLKAAAFAVHRTSASEDFADLPALPVGKDGVSLSLPAECLVTLVADDAR